MNKKIIIVQGYFASGKSTFALQLSKEIGVPYLIKDTFKTAICESLAIKEREESRRFSVVTFDAMMYVTERMFEAGYPIIIEGNFVPAGVKKIDESAIIKQLINKYNYESLTFKFVGDTQVLRKRFIEREKSSERGSANKIGFEPSWNDFDSWCHDLDGFNVGGEIINVDTTDFAKIDFNKYFELSRKFILKEDKTPISISGE